MKAYVHTKIIIAETKTSVMLKKRKTLLQNMSYDPVKKLLYPGLQPGLIMGETYDENVIKPGFSTGTYNR